MRLLCRIGLHRWQLLGEGNDRWLWVKDFRCRCCPAEKQSVRHMH